MTNLPKPPDTHDEFHATFPQIGEAWEMVAGAGGDGPLDAKTRRLVKLAVAMGAQQEGAVHASVRKALAMGITHEELEQVVALAAGTLGFPQTVAVYTWVTDLF
jgi:4-carboxymuconolactone decarboxylase